MSEDLVYLKPRRSATAPAACSSGRPGSGTEGPAGRPSHSGGRCWWGLGTKIQREQIKVCYRLLTSS